MKVIRLLFIMTLLSICSELAAQGPEAGRRRGRGMGVNMDSVKAKLALTDEQVTEFKAIQEAMGKKRREIFEASGGDREAMREAMMAAREENKQQIKDILTVEQWNKYEAYLETQRAKRGQRGPRQGGEGPPPKRKKKRKKNSDS